MHGLGLRGFEMVLLRGAAPNPKDGAVVSGASGLESSTEPLTSETGLTFKFLRHCAQKTGPNPVPDCPLRGRRRIRRMVLSYRVQGLGYGAYVFRIQGVGFGG